VKNKSAARKLEEIPESNKLKKNTLVQKKLRKNIPQKFEEKKFTSCRNQNTSPPVHNKKLLRLAIQSAFNTRPICMILKVIVLTVQPSKLLVHLCYLNCPSDTLAVKKKITSVVQIGNLIEGRTISICHSCCTTSYVLQFHINPYIRG
jgi:hypothetical protein